MQAKHKPKISQEEKKDEMRGMMRNPDSDEIMI
jgi:hypothetical protein